MQAIQDPIIPIVGEWIRQTPGTISLGQGVVSYPPPPQAFEQLQRCFEQPNNHKYQAVEGIPDLRAAIAHKLSLDNAIPLNPEQQVVVTAGSNMAFMNAVLAITQPGDEIILPTPYYFNHEMAIGIASCRAVLVPTDAEYQLQVDRIRAAITPKTRAIVTISPNNPTGAVYSRQSLQAVNQLCRQAGIYHISDEAYEYFTYGVEHVSPGAFADSAAHTLSLFSLSKAYGFASWRIGYMVIPQHLLDPVRKIQDTILICPPVVSQYAALGALQAGRAYCEMQLEGIRDLRHRVLALLEPVRSHSRICLGQGAFYLFLQLQTPRSGLEVAERLVRDYGVAVIPGETFGLRSGCYLRVAYGALTQETAEEGMGRLIKGLQNLTAAR
jgi:aspartate/methionine/tyrosine aminotransferase